MPNQETPTRGPPTRILPIRCAAGEAVDKGRTDRVRKRRAAFVLRSTEVHPDLF